jgi:hypothetical protein
MFFLFLVLYFVAFRFAFSHCMQFRRKKISIFFKKLRKWFLNDKTGGRLFYLNKYTVCFKEKVNSKFDIKIDFLLLQLHLWNTSSFCVSCALNRCELFYLRWFDLKKMLLIEKCPMSQIIYWLKYIFHYS